MAGPTLVPTLPLEATATSLPNAPAGVVVRSREIHVLPGASPDSAMARSSATPPQRKRSGASSFGATVSTHGALPPTPPTRPSDARGHATATVERLVAQDAALVAHESGARPVSPYSLLRPKYPCAALGVGEPPAGNAAPPKSGA
jgi:hypothetical protein